VKYLKKMLIGSIFALILIIPITTSAVDISIENSSEKISSIMQDFTHTVFVEYASKTTCPPCVTASAQLFNIYNSGDYDFYFATLITDEGNNNVVSRIRALGVQFIPDVFFDGGFKRLTGGQSGEAPYRTAITQSGERDVPDIDIDLEVIWEGGGTLKITGTVTNNEAEELSGRVRVYVVEKESRWNDNGGNPYHFAALDIPIDKSINAVRNKARSRGGTYSFSKTWNGASKGFGDITQENTMVMAAVFEKGTGYVLQTATADPTIKSGFIWPINLLILRLIERFPLLGQFINLR
jgi:hypothetical protein